MPEEAAATTSETTTDTAAAETTDTAATDTTTEVDELTKVKAEAEKWQALAKKHEARAKANADAAKELDKVRADAMTETEKAVAEAEQRGRQSATVEVGQRLVAAEVKAALTGIVADPTVIIEDLNLAKYVTDTGDVDTEAIEALAEKYRSIAAKPARPDLAQGVRTNGNNLTHEQALAAALERGDTATYISLQNQQLAK